MLAAHWHVCYLVCSHETCCSAGVLCGAAASGNFTWTPEHVAQSLVCMTMSGPFLTGYTQTINDYYDREIDAINEPDRPIPSGTPRQCSTAVLTIYTLVGLAQNMETVSTILHHLVLYFKPRHAKGTDVRVERYMENTGMCTGVNSSLSLQEPSLRQRSSSNSWCYWPPVSGQPLRWTSGWGMRCPRCSTWQSSALSSPTSTLRRPSSSSRAAGQATLHLDLPTFHYPGGLARSVQIHVPQHISLGAVSYVTDMHFCPCMAITPPSQIDLHAVG